MSPLLLKGGYPFALDMSFGPRMKVPPEAFGLGVEFGRRLPDFIWISLLSEVIPPEVLVRILLFSIPFVSGCAAFAAFGSLFGDWGRRAGRDRKAERTWVVGAFYAGLLYELNPFVYQRLAAGHWHILLGYAVYPLMVVASVRFTNGGFGWPRWPSPAGGSPRAAAEHFRKAFWLVVLASAGLGLTSFAVSVMGLITLLVAVALSTSPAAARQGPARVWAKPRLAVLAVAAWVPGNATWLVPAVLKAGKVGGFSELDWRAFLVRGNDPWEAFLNVVRLTGFYREDLAPPSLGRPAGWLASGAVVALALGGAAALFRHRNQLFAFSVVVPVVFALLALGERAPLLGPALAWAYVRLPGWQIFRETQKLLVPVCFFYAALGGYAVSSLARMAATSGRDHPQPERSGAGGAGAGRPYGGFGLEATLLVVAALLVPFALSPDLFFGLRGRISISAYPAGWYEAAAALPPGDGKLLVFPWHQHMPFEFTGGRTNVNPAADFFPKEVVQSTRAEFPGFLLGVEDPIDSYVRNLIALGPALLGRGGDEARTITGSVEPGLPSGTASSNEGTLALGGMRAALAPLGVDSVVVFKTADWEAYGFLEDFPDLHKVVDNDDLRLYVVAEPTAAVSGFEPASHASRVQRDDTATSSSAALLEASCPAAKGPDAAAAGTSGSPAPRPEPDRSYLVRKSPFRYEIPGPGCWLVPEAFAAGWSSGAGIVGDAWGGAAVGIASDRPTSVFFWPAFLAIGTHLLTVMTLGCSCLALARRRRIRLQEASDDSAA